MTKFDLISMIKNNLQDRQDQLSTLDQNLTAAILQYSRYRPRICRSLVTGTGVSYIALPTDWQTGFSTIRHLEYFDPAVATPTILSAAILTTPDAIYIQTNTTLQQGVSYWAVFTKAHECTETDCTIPLHDVSAVTDYATMQSYLQLAALHVPSIDQTFDMSPLRQQSAPVQYQKLADTYFIKWQTAMCLLHPSLADGARIEWTVSRDVRKLWH